MVQKMKYDSIFFWYLENIIRIEGNWNWNAIPVWIVFLQGFMDISPHFPSSLGNCALCHKHVGIIQRGHAVYVLKGHKSAVKPGRLCPFVFMVSGNGWPSLGRTHCVASQLNYIFMEWDCVSTVLRNKRFQNFTSLFCNLKIGPFEFLNSFSPKYIIHQIHYQNS